MKLYLASAYDVHPGLDTVLSSAALDTEQCHFLCESADYADAIVFIENTQFDDVAFNRLNEHALVRRYPDKIFMYNEMDRPWDVFPGLYACMPEKHFDATRQRAFAYLSTPNSYVRNIYHENAEQPWLYSFMGAMSHKCRRKIMRLPDKEAYLEDTSEFNVWNTTAQQMDTRSKHYAGVLGSSKFVLCPRGIGTSSIRLYETLEAGRVPVIISDQWVEPAETDWRFAVRVKEKNIRQIPEMLKSLETEAAERGQVARDAWLNHYSPGSLFNTVGNAILDIQRQNALRANTLPTPANSKYAGWNKWLASGTLYTRTAIQRIRGQR